MGDPTKPPLSGAINHVFKINCLKAVCPLLFSPQAGTWFSPANQRVRERERKRVYRKALQKDVDISLRNGMTVYH